MPDLDSYFKMDKTERDSHPLIRLLEAHQGKSEFGEARVEILRQRVALGFDPAQLSLQFFNKQGKIYEYKTEPWDAELNNALIDHRIRAVNESNEIQRFGLGLGAALEHPENRYGDGFFSAVLMLFVDQSPFAQMDAVRQLRPYLPTNRPYDGGHSLEDCRAMVQAALQDRWLELRRKLGYDKPDAERILAGALAYYLDERFSITDGRKLGWLTAK
jgi:hypothetical protein